MEETGHWVTDSLPTFAKNLHILLVDHDHVSLKYLASLLQQQSYIVTTTELASSAISMIMENGLWFDLVMANASMPDMDSFSFLDLLLKKNIAVIMMSSGTHLNIAVKALAEGACFLLEKPVIRDDLKYLWQHAYRRNENNVDQRAHYHNDIDCHPTRNGQIASHNGHVESNFGGKRSTDGIQDLSKQKRVKFNLKPVNIESTRIDVDDCEKRREHYITGEKRSRIVWNAERRRKFTDALNKLGDKTRPKLILNMMNEPCLSLRQVANHLQKYKAQVECDENKLRNILPSRQESRSDFSATTRLSPVKSTTRLTPLNSTTQLSPSPVKKRNGRRNRHGKRGLISSVGRDKFRLIAPRTLPHPQLPVSNFVNHGLRMLNNSFENVGLNYNPVSLDINKQAGLFPNNIEDFRIQGSTFPNESWRKFVIGEGVQAFESGNLPNVSTTTPAYESGNLQNVSEMTPENTSSDILDDIQFPDNLLDVIQELDLNGFGIENQEAMEYSGNTEEMQSIFGEIDLPNLDNVFADFIDESNQFGNILGQEIFPSGFTNEGSEQFPEYVDPLNVLEDDPYYSGSDISLSEVDKYSEWLRDTVIENRIGPESLISNDAEMVSLEYTR